MAEMEDITPAPAVEPAAYEWWIAGERVLLRDTPCSLAMGDHLVPLTKTQLLICFQLLQHYAQPTPYHDLGSQSVEVASPSLQQQISRLRPKLHALGLDVRPVRSLGYVLFFSQE
jgi:DNA-binding response OmpR family regulator